MGGRSTPALRTPGIRMTFLRVVTRPREGRHTSRNVERGRRVQMWLATA